MSKNFYNPKYKTKQIFDLSVSPTDTPQANELFYWITYENNKIYGNYRLPGQEDKKLLIEAESISSSSQTNDISYKVNSIIYDSTNKKLIYSDDNNNYDVLITGLLSGASFSNDTLHFNVANGQDIDIQLPASYKKYISSGNYNSSTNDLTFTYTDGNSFTINLSSLSSSYTSDNTSTINTNISNSKVITANLKISSKAGNQLQIENDGIYVPAFEDLDVSDFITQSDLDNYVIKIPGKGLSTKDFTAEYETKLNNLSNYTLPTATTSEKGGIIVGQGLSINNGVLSVSINQTSINSESGNITLTAGKNISINKSNKNFTFNVNIEWNNTQSYNQNEFCSYNGKWYVSKLSENINHIPTDTNYWTEYTSGLSSINITDVTGLQSALDEKISNPSGGSVGQILKKTANGVEWSNDLTGTTIQVDSQLSSDSENPVQNKTIKEALDEKITAPDTGNEGQFLTKTQNGTAWANVTTLNYLLFKIPLIENNNLNIDSSSSELISYHLYVEFSTTDTFDTTIEFNTYDNTSLFKAFTGIGMTDIQNTGLNYLFSNEILQLNISSIDVSYKYFRYHWTNDNATTFGKYGYGNREAGLQLFDISNEENNTKNVNANKIIEFTSSNSENVIWNENTAVFTHNMNCTPIGAIYDENMEQVLYAIKIINNNVISIDFKNKTNITGTWKLILASVTWNSIQSNETNVETNVIFNTNNQLRLNETENSDDTISINYDANCEIKKINLISNSNNLIINPCLNYIPIAGKVPTFEMWLTTTTPKTTIAISNDIQVIDNIPLEIMNNYVYVFTWRFVGNNQLFNFSHKFIDIDANNSSDSEEEE